MKRSETGGRPTARTATWVAAGAAVIAAATLVGRRLHLAPLRALVGARYDAESGRGRAATPASPDAREAGHETVDMRGGLMAKLVLLLGSVALCMVFAMLGLRIWLTSVDRSGEAALTRQQTAVIVPPDPHLQRNPLGEIAALRQSEEKQLNGTAYLDDGRARARIPLDRAMALTVGQPLAPPP